MAAIVLIFLLTKSLDVPFFQISLIILIVSIVQSAWLVDNVVVFILKLRGYFGMSTH